MGGCFTARTREPATAVGSASIHPHGALNTTRLCGSPPFLPAVGNVPPFGHRRPLPVIVDTSVTAYQTCYAGGGSEEAEVFLAVRELLRATGATVADICAAGSFSSSARSSDSELPLVPDEAAAAVDGAGGERLAASAAAAAALPLPWQPGQEEVVLEGIIAHRCGVVLWWNVVLAPAPGLLLRKRV